MESGGHILLSAVPMAMVDVEDKSVDSCNVMKIFAAGGVEFLLSCEGEKVTQFHAKTFYRFSVCSLNISTCFVCFVNI